MRFGLKPLEYLERRGKETKDSNGESSEFDNGSRNYTLLGIEVNGSPIDFWALVILENILKVYDLSRRYPSAGVVTILSITAFLVHMYTDFKELLSVQQNEILAVWVWGVYIETTLGMFLTAIVPSFLGAAQTALEVFKNRHNQNLEETELLRPPTPPLS